MKKGIFIALMVISIFLISACDVYKTLYTKQPKTEGEAVEVPEEDITIEIVPDTEKSGQGMEEEKEAAAGEIEIDAKWEKGAEKEIPEEAAVITVDETQLVSLVPKAEDPDKDTLSFTFTSPLNDNGEWQTNYGDAGEYTVTVTASDGKLTTTKEVLVIVNKKEEAPVLDSFKPESTVIEIDETDAITFSVAASDLNKDQLTYAWKLDGIEIGDGDSIEYKTTYEDSGSHTIKVAVSDGMFETEKIWSATVNNVNRKPLLTKIEDIESKEADTITIELQATDSDGDKLSYQIDDERFAQDGNVFTWETAYDDAGEHLVTATVSDGADTTTQEFIVSIENVNRAPVILDIIQK